MRPTSLITNSTVDPAVVTIDLETISPLPVTSPKPIPKIKIKNQITLITVFLLFNSQFNLFSSINLYIYLYDGIFIVLHLNLYSVTI
jgi:hypothetical protein